MCDHNKVLCNIRSPISPSGPCWQACIKAVNDGIGPSLAHDIFLRLYMAKVPVTLADIYDRNENREELHFYNGAGKAIP